MTPREIVESTVAERAIHRTKDDVGDTRSFGNMEQTLKREYWGRFLIELLQNARDAWLASGPVDPAAGIARIRITDDPALIVCNEGVPITPEIVLHSIGKFGESTKTYGAGIGHKGIGFKSVLEISLTPELYSRVDAEEHDLRVRFDPQVAETKVREATPGWDALVAQLDSSGSDDSRGDRIPTLRYPMWIDEPDVSIHDAAAFDGRTFDTLVRLPHDARFDARLGIDRQRFVDKCESAVSELTDEIVLFLGVFGTIVVENQLTPELGVLVRRETEPARPIAGGGTVTPVRISRNDTVSSEWWLYERSLEGFDGLEGDLSLAIRVQRDADAVIPLPPSGDGQRSSAESFHLFFPTRIRTHLPFVPQAYFEVDASRKGFAADSEERNRRLLEGLEALAIDAIRDLGEQSDIGRVDLTPLADLFAAAAGEPEDELAATFRSRLLEALDDEPWVAARPLGSLPRRVSPGQVIAEPRGGLARQLPLAFPPVYLHTRTGLRYPASDVGHGGLAFLAERAAIVRSTEQLGLDAETARLLLTPGSVPVWHDRPDDGFRGLLEALEELIQLDKDMEALIAELRAEPAAQIVPVVSSDDAGGREMRALRPRGRASVEADDIPRIMARIRRESGTSLAPPPSLGIDFVADGVLDAELLGSIGTRLGIRPYTTVAVLDALAGREPGGDPEAEVRFAWRLLLRESESGYSVASALRESGVISPETWFWARPGDAGSEAEADRRRRERALSSVNLPTMAGVWRPAGELAFGSAWADWLESGPGRVLGDGQRRVSAYRDLEELAPSSADLLASPDTIRDLLPLDDGDIGWVGGSTSDLPDDPEQRYAKLTFTFLLRLGVWEVPPIVGLVDRRDRPEEEWDPWADLPKRDAHIAHVRELDTPFNTYPHRRVHVAEDYRLAWAIRSTTAMTRSLARAWRLLEDLRRIVLFCPRCRHSTRKWSDDDRRYESYLIRELRTTPWVPVTLGGLEVSPVTPGRAWDVAERPEAGRMAQSWMRFLPLVEAGFDPDLTAFLGVGRVETADVPRIKGLLLELREQFEAGAIDAVRRSGSFPGQAFAALHWRLYERLARVDPEAARSVAEDVGVLATMGTTLGYYEPGSVRHDDGAAGGYKRHFQSRVPFSVLRQDMGSTADALGISRLRISVRRGDDDMGIDVTDRVRPFIHERAADLLALQVYRPIFGAPLELGSRTFRERAARLDALRVIQLDNLVLHVSVVGTDIEVTVGEERNQDVYLEAPTTARPILYHDLSGQWDERLRSLASGHLAALLEAPGYAAMFQLLLQQPTEEDRLEFLDEYGVSEGDVDRVARSIEHGGVVSQQADERWWRALLPQLGAEPLPDPMPSDEAQVVRERVQALGERLGDALTMALLSDIGTEPMRRDVEPSGTLALLEAAGVDLSVLDRRLRELGDDGLSVGVAGRMLSDWRRRHGQSLTAVLLARGWDEERAAQGPRGLTVDDGLRFRVRPTVEEWLAPVLELLVSAGLTAEAEGLASGDADYLASLVGMTAAQLERIWNEHFSEEERARLLKDIAGAWRKTLVPVVVSARTRAGLPAHQIRAEAAAVDRELPPEPRDPVAVAVAVGDALPDAPGLVEAIADLIAGWPPLTAPDARSVWRAARTHLTDPQHLDEVTKALRRGIRHRSDKVRKEIKAIEEAGVAPKPFAGAKPPLQKTDQRQRRKRRAVGPRQRRDQRVLDRLGLDAERWVRASILSELLALETEHYVRAVESMRDLLCEVASGELVDKLVVAANEAIAEDVDEDDRVDALTTLVHVADVSDGFGFDVIGWVAPYPGAEPQAMMLEVKSVGADRGFIVSSFEWERAEEERDRYAFLLALRSTSGPPSAMELIPDPEGLRQAGLLPRDPDGWRVRYRPDDDSG